jgi:hypothetical protein
MGPDGGGAQIESSVGSSFVQKRGVILMTAYLVLTFCSLFYSLAALWPRLLPLSVTSVQPNHGPSGGGIDVEIVGTGFVDGMQVFFGDTPAKSVVRKSDNLVIVVSPARATGLVPIEIDAPDGQKSKSEEEFGFDGAQEGNATSPNPAPRTEDQLSTNISNCRRSAFPLFAWACSLDLGIRLILIVIVVGALGGLIHVVRSFYWYVGNRNLRNSWLVMYFLVPLNGGGLALLFYLITRGISSSQPSGIESSFGGYAALAALVGMFSQQAINKLKQIAESVFSPTEKGKDQATAVSALSATGVDPSKGLTSGGTRVRITGAGLTSATQITFDGVPASQIVIDSDSAAFAVSPPHQVGIVDVAIISSTGQKVLVAQGFAYVDPVITSILPTTGTAAGGTAITISGLGFSPTATVSIGGAPAAAVVIASPTEITAVTPAGSPGPTDVVVLNSDGKIIKLAAGFAFL